MTGMAALPPLIVVKGFTLKALINRKTPRMKERKPKNIFMQGAIPASFVGDSIAKHSTQKGIGAHSIFLGQVRADIIDGKTVAAIDYTAYEEMAAEKMH